jgi:DNA-binding NtrC family response regulator
MDLVKSGEVGVVVLDDRLDESDEDNVTGLELMREINSFDPDIPIILFAGYLTLRNIQEALKPNSSGKSLAFDILEKQEVGERLIDVVAKAFEARKR